MRISEVILVVGENVFRGEGVPSFRMLHVNIARRALRHGLGLTTVERYSRGEFVKPSHKS